MGARFGAVGEFLGGGPTHDRMAAAVRAAGGEWSEPMYFQYENIGWGGNRISMGFDTLRDRWQHARQNGSTLIQFVTWNDYTENTCLAPAYDTRYAVLDLNAYFVHWWKTGREPAPDHDRVYLSYRKYPKGAKIFPFKPKQPDAGGVLEVLTILPRPARVRLPGRDAEYDAPAGHVLAAVRVEARAGHRRGGPRREGGRAAGEPRAHHRPALPRAERHDLLLDASSCAIGRPTSATPRRCSAANMPTTTTTACPTGSRCTGSASSWTGPRPRRPIRKASARTARRTCSTTWIRRPRSICRGRPAKDRRKNYCRNNVSGTLRVPRTQREDTRGQAHILGCSRELLSPHNRYIAQYMRLSPLFPFISPPLFLPSICACPLYFSISLYIAQYRACPLYFSFISPYSLFLYFPAFSAVQ